MPACKTCIHFRAARPASQLLARVAGAVDGEVAKALQKVQDDEIQQKGHEAQTRVRRDQAGESEWGFRPVMSDYCAKDQGEDRFHIAELKNLGGRCADHQAGAPARRACTDCAHRVMATGAIQDRDLEVGYSQMALGSVSVGASTSTTDNLLNKHREGAASRRAFELSGIYAAKGRTMQLPMYFDHCGVRSTPDAYAVCVLENAHASCTDWAPVGGLSAPVPAPVARPVPAAVAAPPPPALSEAMRPAKPKRRPKAAPMPAPPVGQEARPAGEGADPEVVEAFRFLYGLVQLKDSTEDPGTVATILEMDRIGGMEPGGWLRDHGVLPLVGSIRKLDSTSLLVWMKKDLGNLLDALRSIGAVSSNVLVKACEDARTEQQLSAWTPPSASAPARPAAPPRPAPAPAQEEFVHEEYRGGDPIEAMGVRARNADRWVIWVQRRIMAAEKAGDDAKVQALQVELQKALNKQQSTSMMYQNAMKMDHETRMNSIRNIR